MFPRGGSRTSGEHLSASEPVSAAVARNDLDDQEHVLQCEEPCRYAAPVRSSTKR